MESKVLDWEAPKALLEYSASCRRRFFEIEVFVDNLSAQLEQNIKYHFTVPLFLSSGTVTLFGKFLETFPFHNKVCSPGNTYM
ncbi:hypothetical protein C5167_020014 [Papaver somniferum]|uniref:Uncharacterized protein n=1 Tax=Papaver somniferum TaxID=3469 RepID=A0A4Y7IVQ8_PAPSO|nr:hypothetical protein C5167_020014 [Papaver somniferum]